MTGFIYLLAPELYWSPDEKPSIVVPAKESHDFLFASPLRWNKEWVILYGGSNSYNRETQTYDFVPAPFEYKVETEFPPMLSS